MNTPLVSKPEDLAESAAGEEDPGSAIDIAEVPAAPAPMSPGSEARASKPGTGEDICPDGSGT